MRFPDKSAWAIILLTGSAMTYTAMLAGLIYLLGYRSLPIVVVQTYAQWGWGLLALLLVPTVAFGIGAWLRNIRLRGSRDGVELDAQGDDEPTKVAAIATVNIDS